ncbi:AraC family transcriptional regulator [Paenibacillus ehimensis]|uniref:AraC family transcriptional regulator n=1 Tax=Paenibacillus ehimensis TaxID=79264 RepID=UPI0004713803|nr:AraC family transcriptional regulator [Paenibacillus ehimensis]MEC0213065.1 AraC family transcriptional regulator [Paenibacillus ehimensis]
MRSDLIIRELPIVKQVFPYKVLPQKSPSQFYSHYHDDVFEILLVLQGSAEFRIGGQRLTAVPGDIFLINEGEIHEGGTLDDGAEYCAFLFDRTRVVHSHVAQSDYAASLTEPLSVPVRLSPADEHYESVAALLHRIADEYGRKETGFEVVIQSYITVLITVLARLYASPGRSNQGDAAGKRKLEKLKEVLTFVETHYREKLTIERAAQVANMSNHHFCRVFRAAVGRTFLEYVHLLRINKAEELIRDTDWSMTTIAEEVGICDVNYFGRLFRKYKRCSPAQLRKSRYAGQPPG